MNKINEENQICEDFVKLFEEPNRVKGIRTMCDMWPSNKRLLKRKGNSLQFIVKRRYGGMIHVFRITRIPQTNVLQLSVYSGDPPETRGQRRPGSTLIVEASPEDINMLQTVFGVVPSRADGKGDWVRKNLEEELPEEYYKDFIYHAMKMSKE